MCKPLAREVSSIHRTNARSGRLSHNLTMSRIFSSNSGSFGSLNLSVQCATPRLGDGRQTAAPLRAMLSEPASLIPTCRAMVRVLH
jgi:hypothetical protein